MRVIILFAFAAAVLACSTTAQGMPIGDRADHHLRHPTARHDGRDDESPSHVVHGIPVDLPPMRLARPSGSKQQPVAAGGDFEPAATVLLHESLFKKLVASVLPAVISDAKKLVIPAEKEKHFSFDPIRIDSFDIGSFTIGFAAPNKVVISLDNLVLDVPQTHFDVFAKILFFKASCGGDFSVQIGGEGKAPTTIQIEFELSDENGSLAISNGIASVHFGYLDVYHHFHSGICRVGQDIIQIFVGNIDTLIRNLVEKEATPIATKAINAIFTKMAAKLHVPLAAQPVATADSIQLSFSLLPPAAAKEERSNKKAVVHRHRHQPESEAVLTAVSAFPSRDVEVFVTQETVDSLFDYFQHMGHLNIHDVLPINTSIFEKVLPAAYDACPGCPIQMTTDFRLPPWAVFDGYATLGFRDLVAGISAVHPNGTAIPLLDVNLNGTLETRNWTVSGAEQNTIHFIIAIPVFTMTLWQSSIGHIDISLIQDVLDFLLKDVVVPDFNKKFKGIAIPPIANVTVEQFEVAFNKSADFGLDIMVPAL